MTRQSNNSHTRNDSFILVQPEVVTGNRCHHQFANGTRCRLPARSHSTLCPRHAAAQPDPQIIDTDLSAAFGDEPTDFRSAAEINDFLAKLTSLLIQNRISSRRASVLAYISSLELRTLPAIDHELEVGQNEFGAIVFGHPTPPPAATTNSEEAS